MDDLTGGDDGDDVECLGINFPGVDGCASNECYERGGGCCAEEIPASTRPHKNARSMACSVDFGEYGFAYCIGIPDLKPPLVIGMGVESVGPVLTPRDATIAMSRVFQWFSGSVTYIMEEQPAINRKTCMMEAAFAGMALAHGESSTDEVSVVHVPPPSVSSMFSLPKGNRMAKKNAAVEVAWAFLGDPRKAKGRKVPQGARVAFSDKDAVVSLFGGARCHDMADSLLQFAWYAKSKDDLQRCMTPFGSESCRPKTPRDRRREEMFIAQRLKKSEQLLKKRGAKKRRMMVGKRKKKSRSMNVPGRKRPASVRPRNGAIDRRCQPPKKIRKKLFS
jgi:hypothetical protein